MLMEVGGTCREINGRIKVRGEDCEQRLKGGVEERMEDD